MWDKSQTHNLLILSQCEQGSSGLWETRTVASGPETKTYDPSPFGGINRFLDKHTHRGTHSEYWADFPLEWN